MYMGSNHGREMRCQSTQGTSLQLYRREQLGTVLLLAFGINAIVVVALWVLEPEVGSRVGAILLPFLLILALLFWRLTVTVTVNEVVVSFGVGVIRKRFRIADIRDARAVRNRWYYGWGIRYTPHGWMFNVSGLDAVELELSNNTKFRIGTDEPHQLVAAIQQARQLAQQ